MGLPCWKHSRKYRARSRSNEIATGIVAIPQYHGTRIRPGGSPWYETARPPSPQRESVLLVLLARFPGLAHGPLGEAHHPGVVPFAAPVLGQGGWSVGGALGMAESG